MSKYITTKNYISLSEIIEKECSLSSSQYKGLNIKNSNFLYVRDFLSRKLNRKDLGIEVGSDSYIRQSSHYFLRTKALQKHSFLPEITPETAKPILPNSFLQMNLKKGDLIISKDSNIGEIIILDKDYPNYMLSGALYKLPVKEHKYYLLAFIKHDIFRDQLDFIAPKGATIRHAKTLFLDCKIPMPNDNTENTILFIELLTQAVINKEILIKQRHNTILQKIERELSDNQLDNEFSFEKPTFNEVKEVGRLDTGLYSKEFKKIDFFISNYLNGFHSLRELNYKALRGPNLAISIIGTTHYSTKYISDKFYKLIQPTDLSEYGIIKTERFFGNANKIQILNKGDILFGAEGNIGKVYVNIDIEEKSVTNFHGVSITNSSAELYNKCFVACYVKWLRNKKYFHYYSTGGQGGSFGIKKIENIKIPNFQKEKQQEIAKLYHNPIDYPTEQFTLDNFLSLDNQYNQQAGIYELDKTAKYLKKLINKAIENIINNKVVDIQF